MDDYGPGKLKAESGKREAGSGTRVTETRNTENSNENK